MHLRTTEFETLRWFCAKPCQSPQVCRTAKELHINEKCHRTDSNLQARYCTSCCCSLQLAHRFSTPLRPSATTLRSEHDPLGGRCHLPVAAASTLIPAWPTAAPCILKSALPIAAVGRCWQILRKRRVSLHCVLQRGLPFGRRRDCHSPHAGVVYGSVLCSECGSWWYATCEGSIRQLSKGKGPSSLYEHHSDGGTASCRNSIGNIHDAFAHTVYGVDSGSAKGIS